MRELQLRELTRQQLSRLLKKNMAHIGFNKRTSMQSMREKLNILGGNFAWIKFDNNFVIQPRA